MVNHQKHPLCALKTKNLHRCTRCISIYCITSIRGFKMPRITITLTDRQYELLKALSTYTGSPMSQAITELVEATMPILETTCQTFKALYEQKQQHNQKLKQDMQAAQEALEPIAAAALNQFNLFCSTVINPASETTTKEEAARASTPHTNRGDTPPIKPLRNKPPKPNSSKASLHGSTIKKQRGLNS